MEKKKINLTKARGTAGLPPPRVINEAGIKGQLPFEAGKPILTPTERAVWEKLGWKEGDPPPKMTDEERQIIEEATKERELPKNIVGIKPPPIISIDNLPAEKQAALREALIRAKKMQEETAKQTFVPAGPGIGEAMMLAQEEAAKSAMRDKKSEDDNNDAKAEINVINDLHNKTDVEKNDDIPTDIAGTNKKLINCPHCGWDLARPDDIEITPADKQTYLAALESGKRFVKAYSLMGGNLIVTFRGLTAVESELVIRQLYLDHAAGRANIPAELYKRLREYRLALSLAGIYRKGNPQSELPTFEDGYEVDFTNNETTGLPELLEHINKTVIVTETVKRILLVTHEKFDALVSKIEVHAEDPDFFCVTAGAA